MSWLFPIWGDIVAVIWWTLFFGCLLWLTLDTRARNRRRAEAHRMWLTKLQRRFAPEDDLFGPTDLRRLR